jgi:glyoxylase-like metal-dependent hydrolase (beta-lactamase superfamily II)
MNRKSFIRSSALTISALALANQRLLAEMLNVANWKITMLTDQIGIFTDKGGTILFYMGKTSNVVVDAQFPEQADILIREIKQKNAVPFDLLINTHHHLPATSGNISFRGVAKNIIAHENSKINQLRNARSLKEEGKHVYPTLTYKDTWCEKFGREYVCLYNYGAGHTNGDTIVHFEHADIVHMGDLVFNRRHPGVDRTAGGNIKNWIEILSKVYFLFGKRTKFVFGYAGEGFNVVGTKEDLKAFSNYLTQLMNFVESEIKKGKQKKEIIKATAIPGTPQWKGDGVGKIIGAAYDELTYFEMPE